MCAAWQSKAKLLNTNNGLPISLLHKTKKNIFKLKEKETFSDNKSFNYEKKNVKLRKVKFEKKRS